MTSNLCDWEKGICQTCGHSSAYLDLCGQTCGAVMRRGASSAKMDEAIYEHLQRDMFKLLTKAEN